VAYAAGEAAMTLNSARVPCRWHIPPSRIIDQTRCTTIPRGDSATGRHASLNVYWVLGFGGSTNHALAYQFLKETAAPAMDRKKSLHWQEAVGYANQPGMTRRFALNSNTTK
jgi:hypothetical protein